MMRRSVVRSGFTLVELLVVIAIIVVIMAILFPVFSRAREKVRQISCTSNLRQLAQAMILYKDDHDGMNLWFRGRPNGLGAAGATIASGMNRSGCYGGKNDCHTWAGESVASGLYANVPLAWCRIVDAYVKNDALFVCPSDPWAPKSGRHSCTYDGQPYQASDASGQQVGGAFVDWDPSFKSMTDDHYSGQRGVDHYYTSYRFYKRAIGDPTCIMDDQDPASQWDVEFDKGIDATCPPANTTPYGGCEPSSAYVGGTVVHVTTASNLLWVEEWNVHQPTLLFYGRNAAYRDGHAKWMPANEYLVR